MKGLKWSAEQAYTRFKKAYLKFQLSRSPQANLVWGFFLYTLVGFVLLSIPLFHSGEVSLLDSLFISTSAISTTGLVTISVYDSFNLAGQIIVMGLFQLGAIGYMTLTTYFMLFTTRRLTNWHNKIIGTEFTMPRTIKIRDFIKSVVVFTLIMESIGAIALFLIFRESGMGTGRSLWFGIFHSVSAFCTAGFGLFNDSFEAFADNGWINLVISVLAISGSLGFIVITDVWYRLTGKSNELSFTTRIIVFGFIILLGLGTSLVYFTEPSVQQGEHSLMKAFFLSMTSMTTVGFNTISTGALSLPMLLLVVFLMYVGASPSGTAGGMKITTLTAMIAVLKSRLRGQHEITFFHRKIPFERLYVATSTFMLYTILIFLATFLLTFTEGFALSEILFEVASALGTVGLSTGITGNLSVFGKLLIIILMFTGRVGVLTFGFALLLKRKNSHERTIQDDLAV